MQVTDRAQPRIGRRMLVVIALTALATAAVTVSALAAASTFIDVRPGDVHEPGIGFMLDSGVTSGCTANAYCPDAPVTRAQMATFMHRLSGNAPGIAPSVDAATLDGLTVAEIQAGESPSGPAGGDTGPDIYTARVSDMGVLLHADGVTQAEFLELGGSELPAYGVELPVGVNVDACAISVTAVPGPSWGIPIIDRSRAPDNGVLIFFADLESGENEANAQAGFDFIAVC